MVRLPVMLLHYTTQLGVGFLKGDGTGTKCYTTDRGVLFQNLYSFLRGFKERCAKHFKKARDGRTPPAGAIRVKMEITGIIPVLHHCRALFI